ncbi:major facilitator transporter [Caballeronia choica]|uniref:Major facilitator transporter n=1 Tax=Caballeronia choica TaxID=326476 RepID=A0A158FRR8_9BURK|nr:MFS transporter [Caballeronia choica]SAL22321.1 major facilitator transporter [Caballeronia choica]
MNINPPLTPSTDAPSHVEPSKSYEWKAVTLMAFGMGLVGIDRFLIVPLMPVLMRDLKLDYQDLGHITGALALAWGLSALLTGNLSDRIGFKRVIVPAMIGFSLLAGLGGLATGVGSLIAIRAFMGVAEGAFTPASIIATMDASPPSRHGRNVGIQQMMPALLGLGLTPIVVTQLLKVMNWPWIFLLVALPGFIVAFLAQRVLRRPSPADIAKHTATHDTSQHRWYEVFRYRNVPLGIICMLCWLACQIVIAALFPNYLVDYLHLDMQQMGFVLSSLGFGGAIGALVLPALSDRVGRKPVMLLSAAGVFLSLWIFLRTGAAPVPLFVCLMVAMGCLYSLITLTVGPVAAEAVPAQLMSTASGMIIGIGEVFGGGAAPAYAGYLAKHFGIEHAVTMPLWTICAGAIAVVALKETAPARICGKRVSEPGEKGGHDVR